MKKIVYILFLLSWVFPLMAQVEVKGTLEFNHPNDSLNTIGGLSKIDSLNEGLRHSDYLYATFFDAEISVNDSVLEITPAYEYPVYQTGMMITIQVPSLTDTVNTPTHLKISNHSIVEIRNIYGLPISNEVMKKDGFLMLLFDGTHFVAINNDTRSCPGGFKKMNANYCIQVNRNNSEYFWDALKSCMNAGNHLCNLDEWQYACRNNTGLNNIPASYEWVHSTSNHNYYALIIGSGSCTATWSGDTTPIAAVLKYRYRCCYSLR